MNRRRIVVVLTVALVTGGLASILSIAYLRDEAEPEPLAVEARIAVAARALEPGTVIAAPDVQLVPWVPETVPAGLFTAEAPLVGRTVLEPIGSGEPIAATALAPVGAGAGVPGLIPEGMRAVSLRVDEISGVNGFIQPGTHVDVVAVLDVEGGEAVSRTVLQDVEVLAAGRRLEGDAAEAQELPTVITMLVTLEQAERLALAVQRGRFQLALRGRLDHDEGITEPVRLVELTGVSPVRPSGTTAAPNATPARPPVESTARVIVRGAPAPDEEAGAVTVLERDTRAAEPRRVVRRSAADRTVEVINGTERTIVVY